MNAARLLRVATILDTVPPENFSLLNWRGCGTVACAVGHACSDPELQAQGLGWSPAGCMPVLNRKERGLAPVFNWTAVEAFFGLSFPQAQFLFWAGSYPARSQTDAATVAARIREFVANGGKHEG